MRYRCTILNNVHLAYDFVQPLMLLIKSPSLWAIVWHANPCFILDLRVAKKWAKFDTGHLMKLGASWQALQDSVGSDIRPALD
jgi:hypothetical protein